MSEDAIAEFCGVTGASTQVAKRFLDKYKRVDYAVDAYYTNPTPPAPTPSRNQSSQQVSQPSTSKLNALFDKYKDPDGNEISLDGTIQWCTDLDVDPEDVVWLAIAYELKSPSIGQWKKKEWTDGWKRLGCDTIPAMQAKIKPLRDKLGSDPKYFQDVYTYTFDFARAEGQRILPLDVAQGNWALLIPHGLKGGALRRVPPTNSDGDIDKKDLGPGFQLEYVEWWTDYLNKQGGKGVTKDTWAMFLEFVRTIDDKFQTYDLESAWPSTIDDFVEYAKKRLSSS